MDKLDMFRFGAEAQRAFDLRADFRVMYLQAAPITMRVLISKHGAVIRRHDRVDSWFENVHLKLFRSQDNAETIRMGYAREANVLVIQEPA